MNLYILIDKNYVQKYNGEILKRSVGNKIVKIISNPTEEDLREFGYMELVLQNDLPEYDAGIQELKTSYEIRDNKIYEVITVVDTSQEIPV